MVDTIRLKCLEWLETSLKTVNTPDDVLNDDFPYKIKFSIVGLGPLGDPDNRKQYAAGIVPGRETKSPFQYPQDQCKLPVAIEFRMTVNKDDFPPGKEAELVLGEVQNRLFIDTTLGGLAVDMHETGNEIDLDSYGDKTVQGVVMVEIIYRHFAGKPHVPV